MPIEIPSPEKIHTTVYDNFKGVDYTNDPTNVWRHRSPSGVNMLPDASGRPFKRYGWEVKVKASDLAELLDKDEVTLGKCFYFELAGQDHIFIFCDGGVFRFLNEELTLLDGSDDIDCYSAYDRAFFFTGNGKSAFYIYGNHKVWSYSYNPDIEDFVFKQEQYSTEQNEGVFIPLVLAGCSANGVGTNIEAYNLLGDLARYEYVDCNLCRCVANGDLVADIDTITFKSAVTDTMGIYEFVRSGSAWNLMKGGSTIASNVSLSTYGVTIFGEIEGTSVIEVDFCYGIELPSNVAQSQISEVKIFATTATQFDTPYTIYDESHSSTLVEGECILHTDTTSVGKAWIEFSATPPASKVDGEDFIRAIIPTSKVDITNYDSTQDIITTAEATLIRGGEA